MKRHIRSKYYSRVLQLAQTPKGIMKAFLTSITVFYATQP